MALYLFDKELTLSSTLPDNFEMSLAMGAKTILHWSSDRSLTVVGLFATGGNINGQVICLSNENTSAFNLSVAHESGSEATAANRCRCSGLATVTVAAGGALWFRYNSVTARWHHLGRA